MKDLCLAIVVFLVSILSAMYSGLVFWIMWGWFIAPTFGIAKLRFWQAVGIILVLSFTCYYKPR